MSMSKDGINRLLKAMAQQAIEEEAMIIQHISGPAWKPGEKLLWWSGLLKEDVEFMTEDGNISLSDAAEAANKAIERMMRL